ncbi:MULTISPECIES: ABC transporter permease [Kitasatospora]|uniref:Transport permease protein n=1 Tax=Kitasatospora setae (strain ATCC 33774 / DSM 43861 / JCM 3304 / KCC A-0304 / NBRC 14216 / KM-6054) TaxID=452652 RepID=E4NIA8_KITSK|nr:MULTISPECIES: ABC transporter permease [Kitasatospora]BAJ31238.1 putative ABC transporter permease protein [Kitasatospora setae KM-6054]
MTATERTPAPAPAPAAAGRERANAFVGLSRVMLLGFLRDKGTLFFTLALPLMFLLLFGVLYKGGGSSHVKVAQIGQVKVLDDARAHAGDSLDALEITTGLSETDALAKVRKGELDGVVLEKPDGTLVLRFSQSDQVKSATVQGIVNSLVQGANQAASNAPQKFTLDASKVEDDSVKPIQYLTPGLLAYAVAMGAVYGASFTLVTWRKKRVLRRLRLAPISAGTIVGARVLVSVLVAMAQTALFLLVAQIDYFGLKLTGNWWLVLPLVVCATLAFMSIGLVTGSLAKTEESANGMNQLIILPMSFLGGAFIPLDFAPSWLQDVSRALPLRYLIVPAKSVLSQGGGLAEALPAMGILLGFTAVLCAVAWRFFNWDDA